MMIGPEITTVTTSSEGPKNSIGTGYVAGFLQKLWSYTGLEAQCYDTVVTGRKVRFKHFYLGDNNVWGVHRSSEPLRAGAGIARWRRGWVIRFCLLEVLL